MGCFGAPQYYTLYKHIFTESDIIKSQKENIYLISRDSMYNFIKIIEDSKILEIKNNSDEETIKKKENNLAKLFDDYQLEKNIKFYDDYNQCKKIGCDNDESENEFIIVNKEFLEKIRIENIYDSNVLITFEENTNKKEIYFLTEEHSLEIESIRCGIYRFIGDENEENISNKHDKDNDKKTDVNVEQINDNLVLNINKSNYKEKIKYNYDDNFDNENKKDENEITKNNISNITEANHENNVNNKNSSNNKENNNNSNMKRMSNIINNNIYVNDTNQIIINNDDKNNKKGHEIGYVNPINVVLKKYNSSSMMNRDEQKEDNDEILDNDLENKNNNNIENIENNNNYTYSNGLSLMGKNNIDMNQVYLLKISQFKYPPLIGLTNNGGSSYMNVILQCLSNINILTGYFLLKNKTFNKIKENSSLTKAFSEVIYHLWNSKLNENKKYYSPDNFKKVISISNKSFITNKGNDCKDLLLFLFENIHKELNTIINKTKISKNKIYNSNNDAENKINQFRDNYYEQNKSIITYLFYFDQANIITCLGCGAKNYIFYMNNLLIFPLEKTYLFKKSKENNFNSIDIKDCFNSYIKDETNKENIYCQCCNNYSKQALENKISSYPEILIILLNRTKQSEYNIKIKLSYILEGLDDYMIKLDCNENDRGTKYELIGNILHNGKNGFGHFYCYCKSPVNKKWYLYNDLNIQEIKDPINDINGIPYLLFYQKIRN